MAREPWRERAASRYAALDTKLRQPRQLAATHWAVTMQRLAGNKITTSALSRSSDNSRSGAGISRIALQRKLKDLADGTFGDTEFPALKVRKIEGGRWNEYQIEGTDIKIWHEEGKWYRDADCQHLADLSAYQGDLDNRPDLASDEGRSYDYLKDAHTGGFLMMMQAVMLTKALNQHTFGQPFDDARTRAVVADIRARRSIHPIEITSSDGEWRLVQGRHRIAASALCGLRRIPYNEV